MLITNEQLKRWQSGATILSLLAVPLLLAIGGWLERSQATSEATRQQYLQLSISILRDPANPATAERRALRTWAVGVLETYTPVPLDAETKKQLVTVGLRIPSAPSEVTIQ